MGRKHGRRSYVRMGRSAESLCPPHPASDSRRAAQGDAVRDGHGGDPSRHPGQHLATPDGPAQREARGLRPGRGASLLLPEPSEAGGRDPGLACGGLPGPPQDERANRPRERTGGTVGAPFPVLVAEELFALGCQAMVSISSAGLIAPGLSPPFFLLIEKALRDEGPSYPHPPAGGV